MPVHVGLVVCGAPLASRAVDVARALAAEGCSVTVGLSDAGAEWTSADALGEAGRRQVATRSRRPSETRLAVRPDRVVAFPLTFNTANKVAAGIMDNHVTGMLCEALGSDAAIVATLMVNERLWGHPAWRTTLARLGDAGTRFVDPRTGRIGSPVPIASGTGEDVVRDLDPAWIVDAVLGLPAR